MKHSQPSAEDLLDKQIANTEAERLVLGGCITNPKFADEAVERLRSFDFTLERHKLIFERIIDLRRMQIAPDRVMLADSLLSRGQLEAVGLSCVVDLDANMPALPNISGYITIVKEKSELRRVVEVAHGVIQDAYHSGNSSRELLRSLESRIYKIAPSATQGRVVKLGDYIDSNYARLIQPGAFRGKGIYTGYLQLDDLTGGIFPTEIWLWGAAPAVGKTSIALQIMMHNVRRGIPVLFFSLEMSKQSILNRLACQISEVSVKRFRNEELNEKERARMVTAFEELRELPIYIDDSHALSPADIRARTLRAIDEHNVQLAEIDFFQKMRADNSRSSENDRFTEIADALIGIAKDCCPLNVFSQLTREHRKLKQKPDLPDLRGSGSLEQMAHVILFPYREEVEPGRGDDPALKGKAEFIIRKQREGELATIKMRFIGWRQIYEDRDYDPPPDQQTLGEDF